MKRTYSRRSVLVGAAVALAGCASDDDESGGTANGTRYENDRVNGVDVIVRGPDAADVEDVTVTDTPGFNTPSYSEFAVLFSKRHPRTLEIVLYNHGALVGSTTVKTEGREWSKTYSETNKPHMTGFDKAVVYVHRGHA